MTLPRLAATLAVGGLLVLSLADGYPPGGRHRVHFDGKRPSMGVTLYRVFDASTPPSSTPPNADGVLGYVGGAGRTPHVWTKDEWDRFSHLVQFPCWLPNLDANPVDDAMAAVGTVLSLGWAKMRAGEERAIVLDGETAQFAAWYQVWAATVEGNQFFPVDYGSLAYVPGNMAWSVWAADWNGIPSLAPGQTVGGTQFAANIEFDGTRIDLSVVGSSLFNRGGVGPRHS